jgi:hypothetical protein
MYSQISSDSFALTMTIKPIFVIAYLSAVSFSPRLEARPMGSWNYEALSSSADLIIVGCPTSTVVTAEESKLLETPVLKAKTDFKIKTIFKGKEPAAKVSLTHFKYKDSAKAGPITSGEPYLINLELGQNYLIFLKKNADGSLDPVSGQTDSSFSFKELPPVSKQKTPCLDVYDSF